MTQRLDEIWQAAVQANDQTSQLSSDPQAASIRAGGLFICYGLVRVALELQRIAQAVEQASNKQ
jgi:hypothetical protein